MFLNEKLNLKKIKILFILLNKKKEILISFSIFRYINLKLEDFKNIN